MVGEQHKFSGNILLYDYLSARRAPVFLNRNLKRALEINRHFLDHGNTLSISDDNHHLRQVWQHKDSFLSWDTLDEIVERLSTEPYFVFEVHGVKTRSDGQQGAAASSRKSRREGYTNCRVWTLLKKPLTGSFDPPMKSVQNARFFAKQSDKHESCVLKFEGDPFTVPASTLTKEVDLTACDYQLEFYISFESLEEVKELHACLGVDQDPNLAERWQVRWKNILECPEGRTVLDIDSTKGESSAKLGLEVSMYWTDPHSESVLSLHNQDLRATAPAPTPASRAMESGPSGARHKVTYTYTSDKYSLQRDLLLCPQDECPSSRYPAPDLIALRLHLKLQHENLRYRLVKDEVDDNGTRVVDFECRTAEYQPEQRASAHTYDPLDVFHYATVEPIDEIELLRGGSDATSRQTKSRKRPKPVEVIGPSLPTRKPPDKVLGRSTICQKPKYRVPKPPRGVTFVRSISRRVLRPGEYISESDEDPDETWIVQKKTAEYVKDTELQDDIRQFLEIFDSFMRDERLSSDLHASDALVRFVRVKSAPLWRAELQEAFRSKLDQLLADGIILNDVHVYCLETFGKAKPSQDVSRRAELDLSKRRRKGKARRVEETGQLTPITAGSDGDVEMQDVLSRVAAASQTDLDEHPPFDLCLCGKGDSSISEAQLVVCSRVSCIRRQFHVDCIKKIWHVTSSLHDIRKGGWICSDCDTEEGLI